MKKQLKVLVVEDDFITRKLLIRILSELGEVDVAHNGIEALEAINRARKEDDPYHIVSLDYMMPQMDGLEALKQLRNDEKKLGIAKNKSAAVILTTAVNNNETQIDFIKNGCQACLQKPINRNKLLNTVRKLTTTTKG